MSLLTQAMEDVVMLEKKRVPDGEGGFTTDWAEGVQFKAAISFDSSMQARTAEKQGVTSLYTVTVPLNCKLEYHDTIKRLKDGSYAFTHCRNYGKRKRTKADISRIQDYIIFCYKL
jgi:hypothetical protein